MIVGRGFPDVSQASITVVLTTADVSSGGVTIVTPSGERMAHKEAEDNKEPFY